MGATSLLVGYKVCGGLDAEVGLDGGDFGLGGGFGAVVVGSGGHRVLSLDVEFDFRFGA